MRRILIICIILFSAVSAGFASFESVTGDARFFSRGQSGAGGYADNAALFLNPAACATVKKYSFSFNYLPSLNGLDTGEISRMQAGLVYPAKGKNKFGNGSIGYDRLSSPFYYEQILQLIYANTYRKINFGAALNYYKLGLEKQTTSANDPLFADGDYTQTGAGINAGILYIVDSRLSLGLCGKNIFSSGLSGISDEAAEQEFRLGIFYFLLEGENNLNLSLDTAYQAGATFAGFGLEKWMIRGLAAVRAGINTEKLGLGTGIKFKYVTVNYAWQIWYKSMGLYQQIIGLDIKF